MGLNLCEKCQHICVCVCVCLFVLQVIILDPTQENAAELLSVAEMFYANNIPLRLVFVSSGMKSQQEIYKDILVTFMKFLTYWLLYLFSEKLVLSVYEYFKKKLSLLLQSYCEKQKNLKRLSRAVSWSVQLKIHFN